MKIMNKVNRRIHMLENVLKAMKDDISIEDPKRTEDEIELDKASIKLVYDGIEMLKKQTKEPMERKATIAECERELDYVKGKVEELDNSPIGDFIYNHLGIFLFIIFVFWLCVWHIIYILIE